MNDFLPHHTTYRNSTVERRLKSPITLIATAAAHYAPTPIELFCFVCARKRDSASVKNFLRLRGANFLFIYSRFFLLTNIFFVPFFLILGVQFGWFVIVYRDKQVSDSLELRK